jgi:nucleotide-binding universal stress UspA family protein
MATPSAKKAAKRAPKRAERPCILVPVDGSPGSKRALDHAIALAGALGGEIEILNVQSPVPGDAALFVSDDTVKDYHRAEAKKALAPAIRRLEKAGVPFTQHVCVGPPGRTIAQFANESKCDRIVMGTRGLGQPLGFFLGSAASKVIELAKAPVTVVK